MTHPAHRKLHLSRGHALHLLREMLRIRRFEERCAELYTEEKIRGFPHLYIGEEAIAVGVMQCLTPEDAVVVTYREHGHTRARGMPMTTLMAEMYGKREGCSRGRGGSMHVFDAATRSMAATPSSVACCRWRWAWHWPTRCRGGSGSPPASSHGAGILGSGRPGGRGVQRRSAHPLSETPGGRGPAPDACLRHRRPGDPRQMTASVDTMRSPDTGMTSPQS